MDASSIAGCELCDSLGGELLWQDELCRVILVNDPDYPGYCRVICNRHVREMTDLEAFARERVMRVVFAAEEAVRRVMRPDKINLASFGNMVPHLHWHVIPRFADDRHFPNSIWGEPQRAGAARETPRAAITAALRELLTK
jgi:diadenosine tetraphosphate (Ap4A) HIT family hydrolase